MNLGEIWSEKEWIEEALRDVNGGVLARENERKREEVSSRMKKKKRNHSQTQKTLTTASVDSPRAVVFTTGRTW